MHFWVSTRRIQPTPKWNTIFPPDPIQCSMNILVIAEGNSDVDFLCSPGPHPIVCNKFVSDSVWHDEKHYRGLARYDSNWKNNACYTMMWSRSHHQSKWGTQYFSSFSKKQGYVWRRWCFRENGYLSCKDMHAHDVDADHHAPSNVDCSMPIPLSQNRSFCYVTSDGGQRE